MLVDAGSAEKSARSVLGKLRKEHGDIAVLEAITLAETEHPTEPLPWLMRTVPAMAARSHAAGKPNGAHPPAERRRSLDEVGL